MTIHMNRSSTICNEIFMDFVSDKIRDSKRPRMQLVVRCARDDAVSLLHMMTLSIIHACARYIGLSRLHLHPSTQCTHVSN